MTKYSNKKQMVLMYTLFMGDASINTSLSKDK